MLSYETVNKTQGSKTLKYYSVRKNCGDRGRVPPFVKGAIANADVRDNVVQKVVVVVSVDDHVLQDPGKEDPVN